MASSHRLPLPRFAERSCVCVSIGCYFLHVVLCSFLQTRTVVFSKLEIQPNGVDEGQCYPSFNWLAATSVVSYPSKFGIFQGIFLLGFYFTAGILFISLTMLEMMISLINDIFFSSHLVRKLLVKFVRYFKQNKILLQFASMSDICSNLLALFNILSKRFQPNSGICAISTTLS